MLTVRKREIANRSPQRGLQFLAGGHHLVMQRRLIVQHAQVGVAAGMGADVDAVGGQLTQLLNGIRLVWFVPGEVVRKRLCFQNVPRGHEVGDRDAPAAQAAAARSGSCRRSHRRT